MIGAAMMMGGGINGNPGMGSAMMSPTNNGGFAQQQQGGSSAINQKSVVFCSRCGKSFPATNKFCPHCGDPYNPCPVCGRDNDVNAKRCAVCGATLQPMTNNAASGNTCSRCGASVPAGTKFCPNCGNRM